MRPSDIQAVRHTFDLKGTWKFCLETDLANGGRPPISDESVWGTIQVPGSWEEQGYGNEPDYHRMDTWTKISEYEGTAWYSTIVDLPVSEPDCEYVLRLEGVRWTTDLWVNGHHAGQRDSLLVAHEWDITSLIHSEGQNQLELRVDNTMKLSLAGSHIHSIHTATAWGGITGGAYLDQLPSSRIKQLYIQPDAENGIVTIRYDVSASESPLTSTCQLHVDIRHPDGSWLPRQTRTIASMSLPNEDQQFEGSYGTEQWDLDLGQEKDIALWSDRSPRLYQVVVSLQDEGRELDRVERTFGMRSFRANGKKLELNSVPVFLRGYVDCCIFPLTGYPVWDKQHYVQQFRTAKSYGFNHVRLHGWSAPRPFWEAADEEGMLVQAELPHWSRWFENRDVKAPAEIRLFLTRELKGLLHSLHTHPSFVMFSLGNELIGPNGHPELNDLVELARSIDPTRLYTDNTGFGQLPAQGRNADFYIQSLNWHPPLESELSAVPDTTLDYHDVTRLTNNPVVGHEHAQFTMYVRPQEREKYTGVLRPSWLESIEESIARRGLADDVEDFQHASGIHLMRSLKEAMERVRRTPDAAGIQLLDIRDFPGQGHATTGVLDVFWESKGIVEPAAFKQFNESIVLLLGSRQRTYYAGEPIYIEASISHYGERPIVDASIHWKLIRNHIIEDEGEWAHGDISCGSVVSLGRLTVQAPKHGAAAFVIEAEIRSGHSETVAGSVWYGWSFPHYHPHDRSHRIWNCVGELQPFLLDSHHRQVDHLDGKDLISQSQIELVIISSLTPNILDYLMNGGHVWLQAKPDELYDVVDTKYLPVFWNYLMFATQSGATMGMNLQEKVPLLGRFPHDQASDWHWYHLVNGTPAICLDSLHGVRPSIEVIDHFHRAKRLAYAFEARVGRGKLLVSSLPFANVSMMKRPEAAFLFQEMIGYLLGDQFDPVATISTAELLGIVKLQTIQFTL
ncbi:glycoside hydrolase family 2 protein [Paenibacillus illinoisensis]|uniref:Glycoside hydrolase family protein n=1 Tax=Paenibacillus illinoisensis TaxID=59845 RepID=A0A2W0CUD9_9BACL|nr:sugar-binding domain-containing protein [Paenibacillus illinoisensis]PYY27261.1 Glycoside hydrolase family protein [Paenibacillus illinoisensis]